MSRTVTGAKRKWSFQKQTSRLAAFILWETVKEAVTGASRGGGQRMIIVPSVEENIYHYFQSLDKFHHIERLVKIFRPAGWLSG